MAGRAGNRTCRGPDHLQFLTTATVRLVSETRYRAAALNLAVNLLLGLTASAVGLALTA